MRRNSHFPSCPVRFSSLVLRQSHGEHSCCVSRTVWSLLTCTDLVTHQLPNNSTSTAVLLQQEETTSLKKAKLLLPHSSTQQQEGGWRTGWAVVTKIGLQMQQSVFKLPRKSDKASVPRNCTHRRCSAPTRGDKQGCGAGCRWYCCQYKH